MAARRRAAQALGRLLRRSADAEARAGVAAAARPFAASPAGGPAAAARGPVSYLSLGVTAATGLGLALWYRAERDARLAAATARGGAVAGAAALGGPFALLDAAGRPFSDADLAGAFALLYFGFTHCPDVCPEELEKIAAAVDAAAAAGAPVTPVFITLDPARDGPAEVGAYAAEFHPRLVALTGSPEATAAAARAYRVYHTRAAGAGGGDPDAADAEDYLIDHSIITYLVDPEGKFATFFGKNAMAEEVAAGIAARVAAWRRDHPGWAPREVPVAAPAAAGKAA
jgi:protein SCO1/2